MTARSPFLVVALLAACAGTPKQVVNVAQADLACEQVEVTEVGDNRYAATGCGRGGMYAELCGPGGCNWVRLRGAHDDSTPTSGGVATGQQPPAQREIIAAPAPAQREVIAAPPPAQRQIIQAPPPADATTQQSAPAQATDGSQAPEGAAPNSQQPFTPQATPLSQGELSAPYQAEVPATPVVQRVAYAPPAPLYEERPPPPVRSYVWVSGYWWWNTPRWVWVSGYWCPPRYGYSYVPGSWYWSSNYWWYGPGGWARPGGTYIVHRLPPRPHRTTTVRDFTPHRATGLNAPRIAGTGSQLGGSYPTRSTSPSRVAPPSRGFTPQGSPMYRYPTSVAPNRAYGSAGARMSSPSGVSSPSRASSPRRFPSGLGSANRSRGSFSSPSAVSPRSFSAPSRAAPPRGSSFSSGGGRSFGGSMSAPLRAPSRAPTSVPRGSSLGRGR